MSKTLRLYYNPTGELFSTSENEGFGEVLDLLESLRDEGHRVEIIDTSRLTADELQDAYGKAVVAAVWKHLRIRQVFGSRRHGGGWLFGKQVPGLLVYEDEETYPTEVYPHERGRETVTIKRYLESLLRKQAEKTAPEGPNVGVVDRAREFRQRVFGQRLMSTSAAELIREARGER